MSPVCSSSGSSPAPLKQSLGENKPGEGLEPSLTTLKTHLESLFECLGKDKNAGQEIIEDLEELIEALEATGSVVRGLKLGDLFSMAKFRFLAKHLMLRDPPNCIVTKPAGESVLDDFLIGAVGSGDAQVKNAIRAAQTAYFDVERYMPSRTRSGMPWWTQAFGKRVELSDLSAVDSEGLQEWVREEYLPECIQRIKDSASTHSAKDYDLDSILQKLTVASTAVSEEVAPLDPTTILISQLQTDVVYDLGNNFVDELATTKELTDASTSLDCPSAARRRTQETA